MMTRWRDRSTAEILVLVIAATICGVVIATTITTFVFAFIHPGESIEGPSRLIADVMNTLIGLLAGFLAGTTTATVIRKKPPPEPDEGSGPP